MTGLAPQSLGDRHDWSARCKDKGIPRPWLGYARCCPDLRARERWNSGSRCGRHIGPWTNYDGHACQCSKMASLAPLAAMASLVELTLLNGIQRFGLVYLAAMC